jgi:polyphenol oxidase
MPEHLQSWEFAENVFAACTTRIQGYSKLPYAELNLGYHVGDETENVRLNRLQIKTQLALPAEPHWLNQVHGSEVIEITKAGMGAIPAADGSYTRMVNEVLAIQVADCLPILISAVNGSEIMALHAGWRSLQAGIIQRGLSRLGSNDLRAWIGPGIRQCHFEVGLELQKVFDGTYFCPGDDDQHLNLDLAGYAADLLRKGGVTDIIDTQVCTVCCNDAYFSHRREGPTGRFAALLWKAS